MSNLTSKRQKVHTDVMHEGRLTPLMNHIPHLSDHAKLSVRLAAQFSYYMSSIENGVSYNMPNSYRWIKESSFIFRKAFNADDVKEKISRFMESSFIVQNQKFSTTEAVYSFYDVIYTACSKSLKKINRQMKSKRKLKPKKRFDHDLMKMRREMLRKGSKFPNDPIIRGSFFKFRKLYSRCCKKKCKEFRSCFISQLVNMYENDQKAYWKLLKNLKEVSSPNDPSQSISANEWLKHFETLYKINDEFSHQEEEFQNQLKDLTNVHTFSELDSRATDKEVLLAIRNLKHNKSAGLDGIKNEMLKNSQIYLLPCIVKLFKLILSSGVYPQTGKWATSSHYIKAMMPLILAITAVSQLCRVYLSFLIAF